MREARLLSKTSSCVYATSGAPGQGFKLHLVNVEFAPSQFYVFDSPCVIPWSVPVQHEKDAL